MVQITDAGIDHLMPLDWLPANITLTNNSGAHGAKAEDYCTMALLMLQTRMAGVIANQNSAKWQQVFTPPIAGKTAVVIGFTAISGAAGRAANSA